MAKKVLMAFDDPGGGLAVSTLISPLQDSGIELVIYSGKLSEKFTGEFDYEKIESNISKEEAEKIILKHKPDMVLTGTSAGNAEQELRNYCRKNDIPGAVILDFWKDYARRWLYAEYSIEKMKEFVFVMDEFTVREMTEEGFPVERLIATGHPYLDKIFNRENSSDNKQRRNSYLFLSQPLDVIGVRNYKVHPLEILLTTLTEISSLKKEKKFLTVKLHPVERLSEELSELALKYKSDLLGIRLADENKSTGELFDEAEIVFGYNTIAMFEARAKNRRTISLKPVEVKKSLEAAMQKAGIEISDLNSKNLKELILRKWNDSKPEGIFLGGIENCKNEILKILN